jgi:hypothetical protein
MFRWSASRQQDAQLLESARQHREDSVRKQLLLLEAVSARHSAHVTIMWQAPSLGVAAQAFLLTIALAPGASTFSRIVVAGLGIVIVVLVSQFMAKHRHASQRDGRVLAELAERLELSDILEVADEVKSPWLSRRSSYVLWRIGLTVFLLINISILVLAIVYPEIFAVPSNGQPK